MISEYIGIPYKFRGRDRDGVDCYGLVWLMEKELWGKELPKLNWIEDKDRVELISQYKPLIDATEVTDPIDGDIALLYLYDTPTHIGIYYNKGIIHASVNRDVVYEKLNARTMQRFTKREFYRV